MWNRRKDGGKMTEKDEGEERKGKRSAAYGAVYSLVLQGVG